MKLEGLFKAVTFDFDTAELKLDEVVEEDKFKVTTDYAVIKSSELRFWSFGMNKRYRVTIEEVEDGD